MRRLYLQIYLGLLAVLGLVTAVALLLAWAVREEPMRYAEVVRTFSELVAERLPGPEASPAALREALDERAGSLKLELAIWGSEGRIVAAVGEFPGQLPVHQAAVGPLRRAGPAGVVVRLADGRWLGMAIPRRPGAPRRFFALLGVIAALVAVGAYPLSRRIAGRLERLRRGVDRFGPGRLEARVPVEGKDEVAALAHSFNAAAERIQRLVEGQKRVLGNASHELRTPLTRLRVAVELMSDGASEALRREAEDDISELDALIEDVLVAARVESGLGAIHPTQVELLSLLRDECGRAEVPCSGVPVSLRGDARALRALARNLLENARRHAGGATIEAGVEALAGGGGRLRVLDRGPGVPEAERERIFEPFYRPPGHAESRHGGVGLGLALVREVARLHGGEARCLQRQGGGSVFEVDLRELAQA